ncbi:hypothetical protein B0H13DRAFT_2365882 [Mycena leptocephala]|nr:hypothetical protein B0H13DRAFT_2365882 [Mycena leptocephala]
MLCRPRGEQRGNNSIVTASGLSHEKLGDRKIGHSEAFISLEMALGTGPGVALEQPSSLISNAVPPCPRFWLEGLSFDPGLAGPEILSRETSVDSTLPLPRRRDGFRRCRSCHVITLAGPARCGRIRPSTSSCNGPNAPSRFFPSAIWRVAHATEWHARLLPVHSPLYPQLSPLRIYEDQRWRENGLERKALPVLPPSRAGRSVEYQQEEWEWDSSIRRLTSLSLLRPVDDGTGPREWDSAIINFKPRLLAPRSGPPRRADAPRSGPSGERPGGSAGSPPP